MEVEGLWKKGVVKVERKWRNCRYVILMGWKNRLKILKGVIRIRKLKENRQHNGLKDYDKMTNNDL
jgi:peptidyl-tRNA hydrolase